MGASEDSEQEKSEGSKQLTTRLWLSGGGGEYHTHRALNA